jgi:hypothetical protein
MDVKTTKAIMLIIIILIIIIMKVKVDFVPVLN